VDGQALPRLVTEIPGPNSRSWVDRLAARECPAVTARRARRASAIGAADVDPIVYADARGANVRDADGNLFVDLTAGFAVASVGHAHPAVVEAVQAQVARLPHAMGDAYPDETRIRCMEALCARTGLDRVLFGSSGSDAVEGAVKTARMATGRSTVVAFEEGYHGLSMGTLPLTAYKDDFFRAPFAELLGGHVRHAPFGGPLPALDDVAAVLVEPILGRGGIHEAPEGWLEALAHAARSAGALFILDEVYTGFGRTGKWFAFQHDGLQPDVICVGKGMASGFPISATIGTSSAMDAWGASKGEALHTQTFLGHPVGCAAALAVDAVIDREGLVERSASLGVRWRSDLEGIEPIVAVRGRGLMLALELAEGISALALSRALLCRGFIALPVGAQDDALGLSPPLVLTDAQADAATSAIFETLRAAK
jgi:4-aminobutyrate aminotransferase/(S)-3-amino-2-methylpropionate transaminase